MKEKTFSSEAGSRLWTASVYSSCHGHHAESSVVPWRHHRSTPTLKTISSNSSHLFTWPGYLAALLPLLLLLPARLFLQHATPDQLSCWRPCLFLFLFLVQPPASSRQPAACNLCLGWASLSESLFFEKKIIYIYIFKEKRTFLFGEDFC